MRERGEREIQIRDLREGEGVLRVVRDGERQRQTDRQTHTQRERERERERERLHLYMRMCATVM